MIADVQARPCLSCGEPMTLNAVLVCEPCVDRAAGRARSMLKATCEGRSPLPMDATLLAEVGLPLIPGGLDELVLLDDAAALARHRAALVWSLA
jgi:hypothetical protein